MRCVLCGNTLFRPGEPFGKRPHIKSEKLLERDETKERLGRARRATERPRQTMERETWRREGRMRPSRKRQKEGSGFAFVTLTWVAAVEEVEEAMAVGE